jgi:hypothetical protein
LSKKIAFFDSTLPPVLGNVATFELEALLGIVGEMVGPCAAHRGVLERFIRYVFEGKRIEDKDEG